MLTGILFLSACSKQNSTSQTTTQDEYYGPVVSEDTRTDEEKELEMIQNCIADYQTDTISDAEKRLENQGIHFPSLPLELISLPEISSLDDLTQVEVDSSTSNIYYTGMYLVNDKYQVYFMIYNPTGGSFWMNGGIQFEIDPSLVTADDPQYSEYRSALTDLLAQENEVLCWLMGINVTVSEEEGPVKGYHEVQAMGDYDPKTINDIKAIAEKVFTQDYLKEYYYPAAFERESSTFLEQDGKLYCAETILTEQKSSYSINPNYIIAAKETDGTVKLDMLADVNGEVQPIIHRVQLARIDDGFRLPEVY